MIALAEIEAARERLAGSIVRTPLVRLELDGRARRDLPQAREPPADRLLQAARRRERARCWPRRTSSSTACWTASAGNMAQGVAWWARELGVRCTVVLPDTAPETKIAAIRRLGGGDDPGHVRRVARGLPHAHVRGPRRPPRARLQRRRGHGRERDDRARDPRGPARRGRRSSRPTAAAGSRAGSPRRCARSRPSCKVFAAEVATAAPLAASLEAGDRSRSSTRRASSTGSARPRCSRRCSTLARELLAGSLVAELEEVERRGPAAGRARPRRRRGRGRDAGRRRPLRRRRHRQGRLRRLRREHRRGEAGRDPGRLTAYSPSDTCTRSPRNSLCTGSQGKKMTTRNSTRSPDAW